MMKKVKLIVCICLVMSLVGCGNKEESSYYCDEGTLNGDKCEIIATKEATLTCDEGYTLQDNQCVKETKADAESSKTCESGYTLSGNQCVSDKEYAKETTQVCEVPAEYQKEGLHSFANVSDGKCHITSCTDSEFIDGKCVAGAAWYEEFTTKNVCPSGTKEINGKCKKTANPKTDYSCESGTLDGKNCIIKDTKDANGSCEDEDYTYNTESKICEKKDVVDAQKK